MGQLRIGAVNLQGISECSMHSVGIRHRHTGLLSLMLILVCIQGDVII